MSKKNKCAMWPMERGTSSSGTWNSCCRWATFCLLGVTERLSMCVCHAKQASAGRHTTNTRMHWHQLALQARQSSYCTYSTGPHLIVASDNAMK